MMLGRAFLVHNKVHVNQATEAFEFEMTGHTVPNKSRLWKVENCPTLISPKAFAALINRRPSRENVQTYAMTLADIDKALAPKKVVDPMKYMPDWLEVEVLVNFQPEEDNKLPPHRSGIDYHIPLEQDEKGEEKWYPDTPCIITRGMNY